ncbi:MAG: phosphonoacetaldehyde hydrolase [Coriobacteriia bacterium]|nr:phosphonoacetaldehyde hydrolase [Coriobacteriia bacterium]
MTRHKTTPAVILDWAGTTVDYGCFAPVEAFRKAFAYFRIEPTIAETRAPMGIEKRAHIAQMLEGDRLSDLWEDEHGYPPTSQDCDRVNARFEPALFEALPEHADLLPGVLEALTEIRSRGIAIGSSTGYTREMMEIVTPLAKERGYEPDCLVCPEEVRSGRPAPYMIWRNLEKLGIGSIEGVVKVGDTAADMQEGRNAGCICVGIIEGSSMLGYSQDEWERLDQNQQSKASEKAMRNYHVAGADYIIKDFSQLPDLLDSLI